jgi:hypothetical protein
LQRLWRGTGYLVPDELDDLIGFLRQSREDHSLGFADLRREFEEYVQVCKSLRVTPDDPLGSTGERRSLTELAAGAPEEKPVEIPLRFAGIERLRHAEQALKDLDAIIDVLGRIRDNFSSVRRNKSGEIRLLISASGADMSMHLVYEPKSAMAMPGWKPEKHAEWRGATSAFARSESTGVREWMALGIKAIERKSLEEAQDSAARTGLGLELLPEAGRAWNSSLDTMISILRKDDEGNRKKAQEGSS